MDNIDSHSTPKDARGGLDTRRHSPDMPQHVRRLWTETSNDDMNSSLIYDPSIINPSPANFEPECVLCERGITDKQMPIIVATALYKKHCSSQKQYYYDKDIAMLVEGDNYPLNLLFEEVMTFSESKEFLSRFYKADEFGRKFRTLWKFHQFANVHAGVFGESTYWMVRKNHKQKRTLHEKAIRKMLDKLSNSELQRDDILLEEFMKDSVMFEEHMRRGEEKMLNEKDIQPIKMLEGDVLREALKGTITRSGLDSSGKRKAPGNSRQYSHHLMQSGEVEVNMLQGGRIDRERMPSFVEGSAVGHRKRSQNQMMDLSTFFGRAGSISGFLKFSEESPTHYDLDILSSYNMRKKNNLQKVKFEDEQKDEQRGKEAVLEKKVAEKLLPRYLPPPKKQQKENQSSKMKRMESGEDKENIPPNFQQSTENDEGRMASSCTEAGKMNEEGIETQMMARFKMQSKHNATNQSKQSKQSGLLSTRDEECRQVSKENRREALVGDSRAKSSTNASKERELHPQKKAKTSKLKINVPDNDKLDLHLIRSGQLSIKGGHAEHSAARKKKVCPGKEKVKRKFNAADIEKFLQDQLQTPSEALPAGILRQTSKEKKLESTHSRDDMRKKTTDSKKSIGKEGKLGYFVSRNYGTCAPKASGGKLASSKHSKEKLNPRLIQTSSQIKLTGVAAGTVLDSKMQTMRNLEAWKQTSNRTSSKPVLSFMSTRRLFEEKVGAIENSKAKGRGAVGNSCQSNTFVEEKMMAGKDSVRVSKMISPKNQGWLDKFPPTTQRAPNSKSKRMGRQEIFESLRRCRNTSVNKSGLIDSTKHSIKIPRPKKKEKLRETRDKKPGFTVGDRSRHEMLKQSIASISNSREGLLTTMVSSKSRPNAAGSANSRAEEARPKKQGTSSSKRRLQQASFVTKK